LRIFPIPLKFNSKLKRDLKNPQKGMKNNKKKSYFVRVLVRAKF
jgi:hypothetical protein